MIFFVYISSNFKRYSKMWKQLVWNAIDWIGPRQYAWSSSFLEYYYHFEITVKDKKTSWLKDTF